MGTKKTKEKAEDTSKSQKLRVRDEAIECESASYDDYEFPEDMDDWDGLDHDVYWGLTDPSDL